MLKRTLLAAALFVTACAQSNGDINRVQPNVMRKNDLRDGPWFFRNTVSYTPFNTQFTFPGQTGSMEKLVWEIQEGLLVGYRSYPYSLGAEANVDPESTVSHSMAVYCDAKGECKRNTYYGSPVVAFPILSHFDIQRGYSTATGEQTNVISENTTDRPWHQRDFMRVNWAANVLNVGSGLNWGTVQNPAGGSSSSNWVQPNEPSEDPYDWPTYEYDSKKNLTYFDVTARYMAVPDTRYFEGYGMVPLCHLARGIYDCGSAEIKLRTSMSKVDVGWSQDYEPMVYSNELMSLFGYFRTERLNWDRKFGLTDSAVIRLANRHRFWQEYYQKDADGHPLPDQPIPAVDRVLKPIVYYFTRADRMGGQERYDEFMEPARSVLEPQYDQALRKAAAAAKGNVAAEAWRDVDHAFVLCDNPVKQGNDPACGEIGLSPKFGDLRYSFVNTVAEPVANGLLGYGPSAADPETGQIVAGNSNTYLWGVDLYGRKVTDWVLLLTGEKSVNDYISGSDVQNFIKNNPAYNINGVNRQNSIALKQSELRGEPTRNEPSPGAFNRATARLTQLRDQFDAQGGLPVSSRDDLKAAADELAKHPALESMLLDNPDVQADLVNLLPQFAQAKAPNDPTFARDASRSVLTNLRASTQWEKARLEWLSKNNITMAEFYDRTLLGVANEKLGYRNRRVKVLVAMGHASCANAASCSTLEAKHIADNEIAKQVRQSVWLATTLHELGHTLNLRHNFQGSFDSVNYQDQYWKLRKQTLTLPQTVGGATENRLPRTPNDLRASFELNAEQIAGAMTNYEYSSIMDYSGKIFADWQGLGKYDVAALMFAYSGVSEPGGTGIATPGYVEVFNSARIESKAFTGTDSRQVTISGAAADLPLINATHLNPNVRNYTERYHYTNVPLHFGTGNDVKAVIDDGVLKLRDRRWVKYSEVKKDEDRVAALVAADPSLLSDPDRASGLFGSVALRVPYMFCSDESADGPVLSCNRFDTGPDYFEITRTRLEDYWSYYLDTHFRRDAINFSGSRALNSAFNTFNSVAGSYKHWVFEFYRGTSRNQEQVTRATLDSTMQDTWTMSVLDGINQHLNVMSVPPFGLFMYRNLRSGPRWDVISEGDDYDQLNPEGRAKIESLYTDQLGGRDYVVLPRGLGRRMYSRYDFKSGFGFWNRMSEAGHYNDQLGAMFAAVDPDTEFQGVDVTADQIRYNIPYYLIFRDELTKTFGALWANDEAKVRPILYRTYDEAKNRSARPNLFNRVHVNGEDLFEGFHYPTKELQPCTGGNIWPTCFNAEQNAAPANIQMTWTSRLYALYLGIALFRTNYDLDYAKANQIYRLGGSEQFTVASGYETVEMPDVTTGARYVAIQKVGAPINSTSAVRMINIGKDYLTMVNDPTTNPLPDYILVLGYSAMSPAQANNPAYVEDRRRYWTELFRNHVRDLDLQRGMYDVFGKAF